MQVKAGAQTVVEPSPMMTSLETTQQRSSSNKFKTPFKKLLLASGFLIIFVSVPFPPYICPLEFYVVLKKKAGPSHPKVYIHTRLSFSRGREKILNVYLPVPSHELQGCFNTPLCSSDFRHPSQDARKLSPYHERRYITSTVIVFRLPSALYSMQCKSK
jgi:hypothetical protein